MTRKDAIVLHASANETTSSNTRDFPEIASWKRVLIIVNVTVIAGSNPTLDLNVEFKDPISGNYSRVQTRDAGTNANGAFTAGTWALGAFTQVTTVTNFNLQMRALTDSEILPTVFRLSWIIGGTGAPNATFSALALVDTEEGSGEVSVA